MANLEIKKVEGMKWKTGPNQGVVDHFKIKPGERINEKLKITKVFQVRGEEEINLKILDVRRGIEVEEEKWPNKVFQVLGKGSEEPGKAENKGSGEEVFSLRAGK